MVVKRFIENLSAAKLFLQVLHQRKKLIKYSDFSVVIMISLTCVISDNPASMGHKTTPRAQILCRILLYYLYFCIYFTFTFFVNWLYLLLTLKCFTRLCYSKNKTNSSPSNKTVYLEVWKLATCLRFGLRSSNRQVVCRK